MNMTSEDTATVSTSRLGATDHAATVRPSFPVRGKFPQRYVYTHSEIFACYATAIGKFLDWGGVIVWGIVPTSFEAFSHEEIPSLIQRLEDVWEILWSKGIDREQLIARSMLSPATCCLVNPDKERTVEHAFAAVNRMADVLRDRYQK